MTLTPNLLYITFIEKENACLKIWGQTDRNMPIVVEKSLAQMTPIFEQGHHIPPAEALYNGLLVCAKFKDGMYYRARVTNTSLLHQGLVEVHFIDYGNREFLPFIDTRLMTDAALKHIMAIPPQAKEFILALVTHCGSAWDENTLAIINAEIRYVEMHYSIAAQVGPFTLIRLLNGNNDDLALNIISRRLVLSISLHTQEMILHSYLSRTQTVASNPLNMIQPNVVPQQTVLPPASPQSQSTPTFLNYKALTLEPGSEHAVYVSYVSDGPLQFSVQLKRMEDTLAKLMNELDKMQLQPLEETVIPGTVCVAKCMEDGYFCRAVVTSMVDSHYKVFFVDFGNTEVVPLDNLYQIPFKYVIPKVMAMRFALAGLEKSNVTLEMKCAFKDFVCNRQLTMRVAPAPRRAALPTCELWDENHVYALDVLKRAAMLSFPDAMVLNRGLSQDVRVSYVYSCNRFFIQLKSKEGDLSALMAELQNSYANKKPLDLNMVKENMPCCALYDGDGQWYRAQVISVQSTGIKVRYVDYGNEEIIPIHNLRKLDPEHVTSLKPQALECCLNGYQNMEQDKERDNLLEELILEQEFSMKVFDTQDNRVLVELFDNDRYNVSSLLLEKIALTRSQVSPMLIQDGLKFDHRKRSSFDENQKNWGKRPSGERSNSKDKDNWRNTRSPRSSPRSTDGYNNHEERINKPRSFKSGFREGGDASDKNYRERREFNRPGSGQKQEFREKRERNDFGGRNNDRGQHQQRDRFGSTNSNESFSSGRQKKFDHKRDGSEKSWSDNSSEKSWKKSPRNTSNTKSEFKPKFGGGGGNNKRLDNKPRNFNKSSPNFSADTGGENTWNISSVPDLPDLAPNDAVYEILQLTGSTNNVTISWFHNPSHFYCQLLDMNDKIKTMMDDIQNTYVNRKSITGMIGSPVIAIFPEDNVLYRARILENRLNRYRVFYVDFGNTATVNEVYPIQRKFLELPAQAINCCLRGVVPQEHEWGAADNYAEIFGKESFVCTFLACENEQYLIDLIGDNQNISDALITAGLARPETSGASQIEINILKGQQLRVTLAAVTNLSDFKVFVVPDLTLSCSAHNLSTATQTYENVLKEQLNNSMIIYVDDVIENRLEVTLYDIQGFKLTILEPDDGAFESVDPLCPLPIFYSTLYGWVSHVSPQSVFIQPTAFGDTVAQLLDQLYQHYNESILEVPIIPEVDFTYALRSADGNWYRGRTISVEEDKATFLYVDYGNTESVAITEIRELDAQFLELHMLAIEVYLSSSSESLLEQEITVKIYNNDGWYGEIIQQQEENQEPPPTAESDFTAVITTTQEQHEQEPQSLGIPVILTHFDSPSEFYLQLSEAVEIVQKLQDDLQAAIPELADLENPSAGVLCAAPYSVDQLWYRAQVLDADADITTVRFVDYGNTDVLENGVTSVKTLTPELLMLEQHARRCSLNVKPVDEEWLPNASHRFEELTTNATLTAEIISQDEKTTYIDLFSNGQNIAEILINEELAVKLETTLEPLATTGFVSHLNSPSEFWIQLESSVADLEWIADQLSNAKTFPELEDLTPGSLCAAVFPEDDNWYRARILSNTVAGLEVLFIDYGNSCTCTCMRALPEDLALMPAMAQKCSLQKPQEVEQWTPQASEKFKEIAADGVTIFNIKKLTTGETAIVDLLLDGQSIGFMLLPRTVNCFVTKFESLQSFHIKKHDDVEELNTVCKLEPLTGIQWNEESNKIFCDINQDGKTLFQVEFVTSDVVRLYIDGRDIRIDLGGNKTPVTSTTATPKKYVADGKNEIVDDQSDLVMEIETDSKEISSDIKTILTDVVMEATGEAEAKRNVDGIVNDIKPTENTGTPSAHSENEVKEVLNEIIHSTTEVAAENNAKEILNDIVDDSTKIEETTSNETTCEHNMPDTTVETETSISEEPNTTKNDVFLETKDYIKEVSNEVVEKNNISVNIEDNSKGVPNDIVKESDISENSIKEVLSEIVEKSGNAVETKNNVQEVLDDIVEKSGLSIETGNDIKEVLNEVVEESAKQSEDTLNTVANTLNNIIDNLTIVDSVAVEKPESSKSSRSSSRCSGRFDVEERLVPGTVSRPRTPEPV